MFLLSGIYLAACLASFSLRMMMRRLISIMARAIKASSPAPIYESLTPL